MALFGAALLLISGIVLVLVVSSARTPPPQPTAIAQVAAPVIAAPLRETVVVTPTPAPTPCVSGQSQLAILEEQARVGKWQDAADAAEAALAVQGLCSADRAVLLQKAVTYGLDALYAEPVVLEPFDRAAQQAQVDRYLKLRERARLADVAFPSALEVAREANSSSHHRLTVAAVETALEERAFNPTIDRDVTKLYISALYGVCYWQTKDQTQRDVYTEGLSYCTASYRLATSFKTGQADAATLLTTLVGADTRAWPTPYPSPLVAANS